VRVTLSRSAYGIEDPVLVTVYNGLAHPIWVRDHQSSCTAVVLELSLNGAWQSLGSCSQPGPMGSPTVAAGASMTQRLNYAQGMDTGAGWRPGTYRIALTYALSAEALDTAATTTVYSAAFHIQ
jgi:hypothetical protein